MKNSLWIIGIFIIFWLGLGLGSANAATSTLTFNSSGAGSKAIYGNYEIDESGVFNDPHDFAIPVAAIGGDSVSGIDGFERTEVDESFTTLALLVSENTVPASVVTSSPSKYTNVTKLSPINIVSLHASGTNNEFTDNAENSTQVPEYEIYAMLLVCLGLLGFTTRRRRDEL